MKNRSGNWGGRRFGMLRAVVMLIVCAAATSLVHAEDRAMNMFSPVITRADYLDFCKDVDATRDQKLILDMLFTDYATQLDELAKRTDAAADDAGRQRVNDAFTGRIRLTSDELTRLRAAVVQAYLDAMPDVDRLYATFRADLGGLLDGPQLEALPAAQRALARKVWLRDRSRRAETPEYGGEGVDLFTVCTEARADGAELAALAPTQFAAPLRDYAQRVDQYLRTNAAQDRDDMLRRRIAVINDNEKQRKAIEQRIVDRWLQWYELSNETVEEIAAIARSGLAEDAAIAWRDRCLAAIFPGLMSTSTADRIAAWVQKNIGDDRSGRIGPLVTSYRRDRAAITMAIRDLYIRGRRDHGRIVHAMVDPKALRDQKTRELYEELLRLTGEQSTEEARLIDELRSMLTPEERDAMTKAIRRASRR
ncbi:MAG: hypothetical protein AAF432_06995 [Planctomycetota bacterium]